MKTTFELSKQVQNFVRSLAHRSRLPHPKREELLRVLARELRAGTSLTQSHGGEKVTRS